MKKNKVFSFLILTLIIFIGVTGFIVMSAKSSTLEVRGYLYEGDQKMDGAIVKLYQNNKIVQMTKSKKGKFQFILFSGTLYMVEVSKPDYISERIQISTKEKTEFNGKYMYEFKVDLMKESMFKGVDMSSFDFPTALIKYNADEGE